MLNKTQIKTMAIPCVIVLFVISHLLIKNYYIEQQVEQQSLKVDSYRNSLAAALGRYDYLPFVLSQNEKLFHLAFTQAQQVNELLESIKKNSGVDEIYIMNKEGKTISSSNWKKANSFVGKNYAYRPYFQQALKKQKGQFFGVGATTGIPGYFVSAPFQQYGEVQAVIVVKISLSSIENDWNDNSKNDEIVFATDENQVIILSSNNKWLYYALATLNESQLKSIKEQKQFGQNPQIHLDIKKIPKSLQLVSIEKKKYTQSLIETNNRNWTIHYLVSYQRITDQLLTFWSRILMLMLIVLAAYLIVRSIRNRIALNKSQHESTSLRRLNKTLHHEIEERKQIETKLREAQVELRRSSKLAAMGQLSASITHELGQPLSAMRTYIASMKVSHQNQDPEKFESYNTLTKLDQLVDRMTTTSQQLRYFARSGEKETRAVDLRDAISGAINTTKPTIEEASISLNVNIDNDHAIYVKAGRIRLEQVIINLIKNAMDALQELADSQQKEIIVTLSSSKKEAFINIADNGPGVPEDMQKHLFEPFYTSKASGVGMGLGLAISSNIITELQGSLSVENRPEGGASFSITLPRLDHE